MTTETHLDEVTRQELFVLDEMGLQLAALRAAVLEEPTESDEVTNVDLSKAELQGHIKEKF